MFDLPFYGYVLGFIHDFVLKSIVGVPAEIWWFPACVLLVLAATAAIDTFTARIPDLMILPGIIATVMLAGQYVSWTFALHNFAYGVASYFLVWFLNFLWYLAFKRDALGLGDAKWTMMAVSAFGILPVAVAWGIGAWLALVWIFMAKVFRRPIPYVHFAPFLFAGLVGGLWWVRMR
jgi:prepilin signal peptidase PulO-like enzyme (type II secretory pathway)